MAKREYILTRRCAYDGCKETSSTRYASAKAYNEASTKQGDWLCIYHSKGSGFMAASNTEFNHTETHVNLPTWSYNQYALNWDGKHSFVSGDGWIAKSCDFPNGTRIRIETTVHVFIPKNPEPMPEWAGLGDWENAKPPMQKLNYPIEDGDYIALIKGTILRVVKKMPNGKLAHRTLKPDEKTMMIQSFGYLREGNRVQCQQMKSTDYHSYKWEMQTFPATVIDVSGDWHTVTVITTEGTRVSIFRGHVEPESD